MEKPIYPIYHPDLSRYNQLLIDENGLPMNDINFVQNQRAEVASILGSNVALNENFLPPLDNVSEDEVFSDWMPKGVQSPDEIMTYVDFLNEKYKDK